jgi:ATP-dependent Clp protease, protease subunit
MYSQNDEFRKYAIKHRGLNSTNVDRFLSESEKMALNVKSSLTPYIIEERQMNVAQMDVFSRLMMDRIIFLGTEVYNYPSNVILAQLLFLESIDPKRDIQIFINSPGGSVIDGLAIYDAMQYVSPDVATICTGLAASMGAVLLTAGAKGKRSALTHSHIMIHQPLGGMQGQVTDMEISYKLIKKMQKDLYEIIAFHTGQPYETIEKDCERDNWMSPTDSKEYGLIDEVLERGTRKIA